MKCGMGNFMNFFGVVICNREVRCGFVMCSLSVRIECFFTWSFVNKCRLVVV